jgi:hypothetical protein
VPDDNDLEERLAARLPGIGVRGRKNSASGTQNDQGERVRQTMPHP